MRVGMVHQPHFLPWPGYLARCLAVDVFVMLDNVKFNRNHFQQRTKFLKRSGGLSWLTLPIERRTRSAKIKDVRISSEFLFRKWQRPIHENYQSSEYYDQIWPGIANIINSKLPSFRDVAECTLKFTLEALSDVSSESGPKMIRSSTIKASKNRTARLTDICRAENITHLVMGEYALASHEVAELDLAGITLMKHSFVGPDGEKPIPGVMGIHYMMRDGPGAVAEQLNRHWSLVEA